MRASLGGKGPAPAGPGGWVADIWVGAWALWMGRVRTRWLEDEAGVRRSKSRRCESLETEERREGECGVKEAE